MDKLISQQAAIDIAKELTVTVKGYEMHNQAVMNYCAEIMQLPSAQPEPEAISEWKKEFREYVGSLDIARDDWKGIIEYIDELPSIQSEQRWIPVEERLPEEGEVVLTQAKFKDDVKMAVSSRIDYNYWTTWGTRDINVIAWMPLPEPYHKGGE